MRTVLEAPLIEQTPYRPDLKSSLLDLAGRTIAADGRAASIHPGDVAHAIAGGLQAFPTEEAIPVWVKDGVVAAFAVVWPKWSSFNLVAPNALADSEFEQVVSEAIEFTASETGDVEAALDTGQTRLDRVLDKHGFGEPKEADVINERDLVDLPTVPDIGMTIRGSTFDEAASIAAAHRSAFGSKWTTEQYLRYMQTEPYRPEAEIIAVDDDGTVAGFAVVWADPNSGYGHFEPVGVHADYHRRGIGTAVMIAGMHRLKQLGMTRASVVYNLDSENAAFYESVGFRPIGRGALRVRSGAEVDK